MSASKKSFMDIREKENLKDQNKMPESLVVEHEKFQSCKTKISKKK